MKEAPWEDMDITVNFRDDIVHLHGTGETLPVVAYFDEDGDDWEPDEIPDDLRIVALTCGPDSKGRYVTLDMTRFTPATRLN